MQANNAHTYASSQHIPRTTQPADITLSFRALIHAHIYKTGVIKRQTIRERTQHVKHRKQRSTHTREKKRFLFEEI